MMPGLNGVAAGAFCRRPRPACKWTRAEKGIGSRSLQHGACRRAWWAMWRRSTGRPCGPLRPKPWPHLEGRMANGRNKVGRRVDTQRDPGGFIALPWSVLDCPAYAALSHPARALLLEFARQLGKDNNGRLLASRAYLIGRGWKSADVIQRAKRELLAAELIFETVKGQRPNRASWYAVTWRILDKLPGYDFGVEKAFKRGAYRNVTPIKNASLRPPDGTAKAPIAPPHGTETPLAVP